MVLQVWIYIRLAFDNLFRELEAKLSQTESDKGDAEQRARELAEKNGRICTELEEIGDLVKQMEAEKEVGERSLKESVAVLEVSQSARKEYCVNSVNYRKRR